LKQLKGLFHTALCRRHLIGFMYTIGHLWISGR